jgi:hypothetical protein
MTENQGQPLSIVATCEILTAVLLNIRVFWNVVLGQKMKGI